MSLSLCVVGCGEFARTFAQAVGGMQDEIDLFFASRDLSRAEAYTRAFGGKGAFGSYEAAAADSRVEAMYLCTPHHLHRDHALMAAGAGKHILVEKPIARTLEEGEEMVSLAQQAGITFMVAENYRFMAAVRGAKELIEGGAIGKLRLIQLQEEGRFRPARWRNNQDMNGGGVFIDGGIHKVDILIYLAGMPEHVYAGSLPPGLPDAEAEDGVVVMTRGREGVVGVINHSWTSAQGRDSHWVSITGTRGRIYFEMANQWLKIDDGHEERTLRYEDDRNGLVPMVREFRDSIVEQRDPLTSGAVGLQDLRVVLKVYESIQQGVSLPVG